MLELSKLTVAVAAPLAGGALAADVVTDDKIAFVALLIGVTGVVVGVVAWVRAQIKAEIRTHSAQDRQRHRAVLAEIRHMRELLSVKFGLPRPDPLPEELEEEA